MAQQIVLTQKTADRILSAVDKVEKLTPTKGAAGMGDANPRGSGGGGDTFPAPQYSGMIVQCMVDNQLGAGYLTLVATLA